MCFPRKPGLGKYNASRSDWVKAYRAARVAHREGKKPDPVTGGIAWKAGLIVEFERDAHGDPLTLPIEARLEGQRIIDELLAEQESSPAIRG